MSRRYSSGPFGIFGGLVAQRGTLRNMAEFVPTWLIIQLLCWLPLPMARGLATLLAAIVRAATPRWRSIAEKNLQLAFPEWDNLRREQAAVAGYRNLAANVMILARLPRLNAGNISQWIAYEGFEHFDAALARGKGVIFLTAHLGVWELSAAAHALYGHPMWSMVRPLDNPYLDRLVDRRRCLFGNRTIRKRDAARDVLTVLRSNGAVGILADQNAAGSDGIFVDFFGRKASATKGVAQIAARTGAAVVPGFAVWDAGAGKYVLQFYTPLDLADTGNRERDLVENTQRCQAAIERAIRRSPNEWLWIHRRWKRQPEGQPAVY